MPLEHLTTHLGEIHVFRARRYDDERGYFLETFREGDLQTRGLPSRYPQDNQSGSRRGVLRGLHFQWEPPMAKLMRVVVGEAFLVAVDIRPGSPTLGQHLGLRVDAESGLQVFAPPGFARGFCALSEFAVIQYKCTALYNSSGEGCIRWDDPDLALPWPITEPLCSPKDRAAPSFCDWLADPRSQVFRYEPPVAGTLRYP